MHLGRLPSRVPVGSADGIMPVVTDLGPGAAWRRTAEEAVAREVDAVVLAGDVVHGANDVFKGAAALNEGLRLLAGAGIPVLAVAGNHDTRVLPELARRGGITLLGAGGTWSAAEIVPAGRPRVRVVGWSFPEARWPHSPLATPPPPRQRDRVTLGVLHADLDMAGSPYAPVSSSDLAATGYAAWLMGHVHLPGEPSGGGRPFYLGSLCGLDPTETGVHGPVLVSVAADGEVAMRRLPLAPLRWVAADLDLTGTGRTAEDLPTLVNNAMLDACADGAPDDDGALAVGIRLRLTGDVSDPEAVRGAAARLRAAKPVIPTGRAAAFLDRLDDEVRRAADLTALAAHETPPGLLARRILVLEGADVVCGVADPGNWRRQLLEEARRRIADADSIDQFGLLPPGITDEEVRREAVAVARLLLERLDDNRDGHHAPDPA